MKSDKPGFSLFSVFLIILYLVTFAVIAWFLKDGWNYYLTDITERAHQAEYRQLRPGGFRSHGFGIIGSLMMITLLIYSIRKRTSILGKRSRMKNWLNFHIYLGISGPLFIILHSTFKLNGVISVSFWSMIAVALSGVIGRYLYLQIPRNIVGSELTLSDVQKLNEEINQSLQNKYHLKTDDIEHIENVLVGKINENQGIIAGFFSMIVKNITIRIKSLTFRKRFEKRYNIPHSEIREFIHMARQKAVLEERIIFWNKIQQLFHYWHIFHKPFAIVMYLIMLLHVGISIWLGYTWIF